jgi:hypothetical protein
MRTDYGFFVYVCKWLTLVNDNSNNALVMHSDLLCLTMIHNGKDLCFCLITTFILKHISGNRQDSPLLPPSFQISPKKGHNFCLSPSALPLNALQSSLLNCKPLLHSYKSRNLQDLLWLALPVFITTRLPLIPFHLFLQQMQHMGAMASMQSNRTWNPGLACCLLNKVYI